MSSLPVFVTSYEILRSQDYVMITLSTPTGEVVDGRMRTVEVQRFTLSHSRFLEFAAGVGQIAANIAGAASPVEPATLAAARRAPRSATLDGDDRQANLPQGCPDLLVRH